MAHSLTIPKSNTNDTIDNTHTNKASSLRHRWLASLQALYNKLDYKAARYFMYYRDVTNVEHIPGNTQQVQITLDCGHKYLQLDIFKRIWSPNPCWQCREHLPINNTITPEQFYAVQEPGFVDNNYIYPD